jgi:hypothetical protein
MDAMNGNKSSIRGSRWVWLLTCMAGTLLLITACGGGSSPSSSSASSSPAQSAKYAKVLSFSQCMRSHGVPNFPDPNSSGAITLGGASGSVNLASSQAQSASQSCRHLLPNGGMLNPQQQQKALTVLLKLAQCIRSHGIPNFPDPALVNGSIKLNIQGSGVNPKSPQLISAVRACRSTLPRKTGAS